VSFTLSSDPQEYTIPMPVVQDAHGNFCAMKVESSTLGSTFYSNSSEVKDDSKHNAPFDSLSIDPVTWAVSIDSSKFEGIVSGSH